MKRIKYTNAWTNLSENSNPILGISSPGIDEAMKINNKYDIRAKWNNLG